MEDTAKYITDEMIAYGDILEKLEFGISDISSLIGDDIKKRDFIRYVDQVRNYLDFLSKKQRDFESKGVISKVFGNHKDLDQELIKFKESMKTALIQSHYCSNCKCLKCINICKMDGCGQCKLRGKVISCNNKTQAVWAFKNNKLTLNNDETGQQDEFEILAIIQDAEYKQYYISLNKVSDGQKYIFYYYCSPAGESYKAIEDVDDFNFVTDTLTQAGL